MYHREPNYEAAQAITNRINAKTRHCRIGKVRMKTGLPWMDKGLIISPQPVIPSDFRNDGFVPWWMRGPWCNQAAAC